MLAHYSYLWMREDGVPYYAGKGQGRRAFHSHGKIIRPPSDEFILIQEWPSDEEARVAERLLIACYGRVCDGTGPLLNIQDCGEAPRGRGKPLFTITAQE